MSLNLLKNKKALSLAEIIIANVILTIALFGMLGVSSTAFDILNKDKTKIMLLNAAKAKTEEIISYMSASHTFGDLAAKYNKPPETGALALPDGSPMSGNYAGVTRTVAINSVNIVSGAGGALPMGSRLEYGGAGAAVEARVTASKGSSSVSLSVFFFS